MVLRPNAGHGLLIRDVSRSHSDTPQSVGLLYTRDEFVAETSTRQNTTHKRQKPMPTAGFETTTPASERLQTRALERAATGFGNIYRVWQNGLTYFKG